jgi:hypothetical protein
LGLLAFRREMVVMGKDNNEVDQLAIEAISLEVYNPDDDPDNTNKD